MKEARIITIVSILSLIIICIIVFILSALEVPNIDVYLNIANNLCCGILVGIFVPVCQYFVLRRNTVNSVYGLYFDFYRTYYYSKNKKFLFHYNVFGIYKKIVDLNPKINEILDGYHGIFAKHDRLYRKLNPQIMLNDSYRSKNMVKTFLWFNEKAFTTTIEPVVQEIEKLLININKKRFEKDKKQMIRVFNFFNE